MLPDPFDRVTEYADADLTFFAHAYRDADALGWMLGHLRRHYPGARAVVCSDGDPDPRLGAAARAAGAEFHPGDRLYPVAHGGRIVHRMLDLFFRRPSRYLFKVDPDTGVHRRFAWLPAHPGVFGSLQLMPGYLSVQGGCCGFAYAAAERLYRSGGLLDPALADPPRSWARDPLVRAWAADTGRVSTDWLVGYAATALGVPLFGFPEVRSTWQTYVPNPDRRYAVTHPCKDLRL